MAEEPTDFFHTTSADALTRPDVTTGTMMGFPCLRVGGAFFAPCDHRTGDLIVKLPRDRVTELVADGTGTPFAPAGRTCREWVRVEERDRTRWLALIEEARAFVSNRG